MCSWENYWTGCHILKYLFCFSGSTVKCGCPHSEVWFMCSVFWPALSSFPATLLFLLSLGYVVYIYFSPNSDVLTWNVLSSLPAIQNMSFQGPALFNSFGNLLAISVLSYFPHLCSGSKLHLLCARFAHLCPTLCDPTDCSPPGSSAHGISQARILEWAAISSSMGSSRPRDRTRISCIDKLFTPLCHLGIPKLRVRLTKQWCTLDAMWEMILGQHSVLLGRWDIWKHHWFDSWTININLFSILYCWLLLYVYVYLVTVSW